MIDQKAIDKYTEHPLDTGPIWLYLSGGGVRTALGNIGVLASLDRLGLWSRVSKVVSVSGGSLTNAALLATELSDIALRPDELVLALTSPERPEDLQRCMRAFHRRVTQRRFDRRILILWLQTLFWIRVWQLFFSAAKGWSLIAPRWMPRAVRGVFQHGWLDGLPKWVGEIPLLSWLPPVPGFIKWFAFVLLTGLVVQGWMRQYLRWRTRGILGAAGDEQLNDLTHVVRNNRRHIFTVSSVRTGSPIYHGLSAHRSVLIEDQSMLEDTYERADHSQKLLDVVHAGATFPALCWPEFRWVPFQVRKLLARAKGTENQPDPKLDTKVDLQLGTQLPVSSFQNSPSRSTARMVLSWDGGINGLFGTRIDPLLGGDRRTQISEKLDTELEINEAAEPTAIRLVVDGGKFPRNTGLAPFLTFIPIFGSLLSLYRALTVSIMSLTNVDRRIAQTQGQKDLIYYLPVCGGKAVFPRHRDDGQRFVDWTAVRNAARYRAQPLTGMDSEDDLLHRRLALQAELKRQTDRISLAFSSQRKGAPFAIASGVATVYESLGARPNLQDLRSEIEATFAWLDAEIPDQLAELLHDFAAVPIIKNWIPKVGFNAITKGEGSGSDPSHSIPSYRHEYDLGHRHFETDVRVTKDGHLVSLHATSARIGFTRIHNLTLDQVRRQAGTHIATADELLDAFPDVHWNFEAKGKRDALRLAPFLKQRTPQDRARVCVSFGWAIRHVQHIRWLLPREVSSMASLVDQFRVLYLRRKPPCDIVQLPHFLIRWSPARKGSNYFANFPTPVVVWGPKDQKGFTTSQRIAASGAITSAAKAASDYIDSFT
jgi:hypothetical protein